jgi:hypothetical protein
VLIDEGHESHETLGTSGLDAEVEDVLVMPHPSYWPFLLTVGLFLVFTAMLLRSGPLGIVGVVWMVASMVGWHWNALMGVRTDRHDHDRERRRADAGRAWEGPSKAGGGSSSC